MIWLWISVSVVLVGGELNAETEHQTVRDTKIAPEKPASAVRLWLIQWEKSGLSLKPGTPRKFPASSSYNSSR